MFKKLHHFLAELKRRNVYRIGVIYMVTSWLILQVAAILLPAFEAPTWIMQFLIYGLAAGFLLALVLSWIFELTPDGLKKSINLQEEDQPPEFDRKKKKDLARLTIAILSIAVIILLLNTIWQFDQNKRIKAEAAQYIAPRMPTLAVLPFENLSSNPDQEFFADGLAEELINVFVRIPQLKVISRSSSFSFKGKNKTIPMIGEALGADYILEGSIRSYGDKVRINTQLIRVSDDQPLFTQSWDRVLDDVLKVQEEIAALVFQSLEFKIAQERMYHTNTTIPEAYLLFLEARYSVHHYSQKSLEKAKTLLTKALSMDPEFVAAIDLLGEVYERMGAYGLMDIDESTLISRQYFEKAIALDSTYVPSYFGLMQLAITHDWDFDTARYYLRKIELIHPQDAGILRAKGAMEFIYGNVDDAIDFYQAKLEYDPVSVNTFKQLGIAYFALGEYELAKDYLTKGLQISPDNFSSNFYMGLVHLFQDSLETAEKYFLAEDFEGYQMMGQSLVAASLGELSESDSLIQLLKRNYTSVMPFQIAEIHAYRKDIDSAFHWLGLAYKYHDGGMAEMVSDPLLRKIHSDIRWNEILTQMKLNKLPG